MAEIESMETLKKQLGDLNDLISMGVDLEKEREELKIKIAAFYRRTLTSSAQRECSESVVAPIAAKQVIPRNQGETITGIRVLKPPPQPDSKKAKTESKQQMTLGAFYGAHTKKVFSGGKPLVECTVHMPTIIDIPAGSFSLCSKGCGKQFDGIKIRGAKATHEKYCTGTKVTNEKRRESDTNGSTKESEGEPKAKAAKLDGRIQNRGSDHRMRYTLMFKLSALDMVKSIDEDESYRKAGHEVVAERYDIPLKTIYNWMQQENEIRLELTSQKELKANTEYKSVRVLLDSKQARRMCLGGGRGALFPLAEKATFDEFSKLREKGLRVSPRMLSAIMKRSVRDIYGETAAFKFRTSKKWRLAFAGRFGLSLRLRNNKKSKSPQQRLPKIKRWFARFRRRLCSGIGGAAAAKAACARNGHRGNDPDAIVAAQCSQGLPLDCGLCALKNATSNASISSSEAFAIARALEEKLVAEEEEFGLPKCTSRHFVEGKGDLSAGALKAIADANDYGFFSLSRETEGECGHARQLLEFLCVLDGNRLSGVVWREGPGFIGESASNGHWIGASHIHGNGDWRTHTWIIKDSLKPSGVPVSAEQMMALLDGAESRRAAYGFVVDMR